MQTWIHTFGMLVIPVILFLLAMVFDQKTKRTNYREKKWKCEASTYNEEVKIMRNKVDKDPRRESIFDRIFNGEMSRFSVILVVCVMIYFILTAYF